MIRPEEFLWMGGEIVDGVGLIGDVKCRTIGYRT